MDTYEISKEILSAINDERRLNGQALLSKDKKRQLLDFCIKKINEFKETEQYKALSDADKRRLQGEFMNKMNIGVNKPVCCLDKTSKSYNVSLEQQKAINMLVEAGERITGKARNKEQVDGVSKAAETLVNIANERGMNK